MEAALACAMLGLMFVLLMMIYLSCLKAWHKTNTQSDLLSDIRVSLTRLARLAAQSSADGVSVEAGAVSLLSPSIKDDKAEIDPVKGVIWDVYRVFYLEGNQLRVKVVKLRDNADQRENPTPIEEMTPTRPLRFYRKDGEVWCRDVETFEVRRIGVRLLEIELAAVRRRYGRQAPERVRRVISARILN